jgi:RimJ/RimL family protein N-acetyltransferase
MKRVADTLLTPRMVLRQPRSTDLGAYTAYCVSDRARFTGGPFTAAVAFAKFAAVIGHWQLAGFGRWILELNGSPIGHAGPLTDGSDTAPELTWTLWSAGHEGKGLASEAASAAARHLLEDCGWPELRILIDRANEASLRVAQRLGAKPADMAGPEGLPDIAIYRLAAHT